MDALTTENDPLRQLSSAARPVAAECVVRNAQRWAGLPSASPLLASDVSIGLRQPNFEYLHRVYSQIPRAIGFDREFDDGVGGSVEQERIHHPGDAFRRIAPPIRGNLSPKLCASGDASWHAVYSWPSARASIDLDWVPKAGRSSYGNVPIHRRGTLTVHLIMSMTERHGWRTLSRAATSVRLRNERTERRIELLRACASCAVTALRRDRWENYSLLPLITAASVLALQCP